MRYYDTVKCGERIRMMRRKMKMTQEELAEGLGVSREFVCKIERGAKGCSVDTLGHIADFFDVSVDYLAYGLFGIGSESTLEKRIDQLADTKREVVVLAIEGMLTVFEK